MLLSDEISLKFDMCPRCGTHALEKLSTHSYCVNCNYEEIKFEPSSFIPKWASESFKTVKPKSQLRLIKPPQEEPEFNRAV